MEIYLIICIVGIIGMSCLAFFVGKKMAGKEDNSAKCAALEERIAELSARAKQQESIIGEQTNRITTLTAERDVERTNATNAATQMTVQKKQHEERVAELSDKVKQQESLIGEQTNRITTLTAERDTERANGANAIAQITMQKKQYEERIAELSDKVKQQETIISEQTDHITTLTAERDKERTNAANAATQMTVQKKQHEERLSEQKLFYETHIDELKQGFNKQLASLREMNKQQVEDQLTLIKEQMRTTSEHVLKTRQEELEAQNKEQVSKIIDPLQKSLKDMEQALNHSKEQQKEALTRLDATIKLNMEKSVSLGETADRLTRALTGEVKVQGNFGELKLKQLLEDLELREGEQFDTQETLKDKAGKSAKGDDGKGLVPDFILHFPNNRHVVVDSKMSLTDYERYMNAEDGTTEKTTALKAHIDSVRAQVKRLARKEYTKYLPAGYNRLNFAIMYVPIEGALNLALLNDAPLWREAYDQGVLILGPQTMYMNLRVLEMMWTQVAQLKNQQAMMDAANTIVERVQDFGMRFSDVETSMNDTMKKMAKLKITTADSGASIITAARNLLKAGAKENKKKRALAEMDDTIFLEADTSTLLTTDSTTKVDNEEK